jgi:hypothetical protein
VEVPHHHVLLLLRLMRRLGHGQGSCQLCTTDLVDGAAQQVVQLKLQRWCVASVPKHGAQTLAAAEQVAEVFLGISKAFLSISKVFIGIFKAFLQFLKYF